MRTSGPERARTQWRRESEPSNTDIWFEDSRPIETSPSGRERVWPSNGPPMPRIRGCIHDQPKFYNEPRAGFPELCGLTEWRGSPTVWLANQRVFQPEPSLASRSKKINLLK